MAAALSTTSSRAETTTVPALLSMSTEPVGLVLSATYDHNGGLSLEGPFGDLIRRLSLRNSIIYREASSVDDLETKMAIFKRDADFIILAGHGSDRKIRIGEDIRESLSHETVTETMFSGLKDRCVIYLLSCHAGEGGPESIAAKIARVSHRHVVAPPGKLTKEGYCANVQRGAITPLTIFPNLVFSPDSRISYLEVLNSDRMTRLTPYLSSSNAELYAAIAKLSETEFNGLMEGTVRLLPNPIPPKDFQSLIHLLKPFEAESVTTLVNKTLHFCTPFPGYSSNDVLTVLSLLSGIPNDLIFVHSEKLTPFDIHFSSAISKIGITLFAYHYMKSWNKTLPSLETALALLFPFFTTLNYLETAAQIRERIVKIVPSAQTLFRGDSSVHQKRIRNLLSPFRRSSFSTILPPLLLGLSACSEESRDVTCCAFYKLFSALDLKINNEEEARDLVVSLSKSPEGEVTSLIDGLIEKFTAGSIDDRAVVLEITKIA